MNMDVKVAEVAGKHPVATNTDSPARHSPPTVGEKETKEELLDCISLRLQLQQKRLHPSSPVLNGYPLLGNTAPHKNCLPQSS